MIDNIVSVSLTQTTRTVSQTGFSTILILDHNLNSAARLVEFSKDSLTDLAAALTGGILAPSYIAATSIFSQNPSISSVSIGYRNGQKVYTDSAGTYTAGSIVATVNGTDYTQVYDSDKATTLTALAAQIQGDANVSTAVYAAGSNTITITPVSTSVLAIEIDISAITGTMTGLLSSVATEAVADSLNAIRLYNDDWYGLVAVTRDEAEVTAIAVWTEANGKLFATSSADTDIIDVSDASDTTSLPAVFKAAGYARSFCYYYEAAATEYPEAGYLSALLSRIPGSYTGMFRQITGATRSLLSTTQSANALAKYCLTYETIGGVNITQQGKVASGEFIDVVIFFDWVIARVQEAAFSNFVNNEKVSFDDDGIQSMRNAIEPPLALGVTNKGIRPFSWDETTNVQTGGYYFVTPLRADVSTTDVNNRYLPGLQVYFFLSGAIHSTAIQLNVLP